MCLLDLSNYVTQKAFADEICGIIRWNIFQTDSTIKCIMQTRPTLVPFQFFCFREIHFVLGIPAIFGSADRKIVCQNNNCVHKSIAISKKNRQR